MLHHLGLRPSRFGTGDVERAAGNAGCADDGQGDCRCAGDGLAVADGVAISTNHSKGFDDLCGGLADHRVGLELLGGDDLFDRLLGKVGEDRLARRPDAEHVGRTDAGGHADRLVARQLCQAHPPMTVDDVEPDSLLGELSKPLHPRERHQGEIAIGSLLQGGAGQSEDAGTDGVIAGQRIALHECSRLEPAQDAVRGGDRQLHLRGDVGERHGALMGADHVEHLQRPTDGLPAAVLRDVRSCRVLGCLGGSRWFHRGPFWYTGALTGRSLCVDPRRQRVS